MNTIGCFQDYLSHTENETAAAILTLADAVSDVAVALRYLGNGNAATEMGAIEALGAVMKEGLEGIASAISEKEIE